MKKWKGILRRKETHMERQEIRIMDTGAPAAGAVSGWAYNLLGREMLALAKGMQGSKADSFADPAVDADYRLWKEDRATWLRKKRFPVETL